jgi:hypothetical protein
MLKKVLKIGKKIVSLTFAKTPTFFKNLFFGVKNKFIEKVTEAKGFTYNEWVSFFIKYSLMTSGLCILIVKILRLMFYSVYVLKPEGSAVYYLINLLNTLDDMCLFCGVFFMAAYLLGIFLIYFFLLFSLAIKNYSYFSLKHFVWKHVSALLDCTSLLKNELFKEKKKAVTVDRCSTYPEMCSVLLIAYLLGKVFLHYAPGSLFSGEIFCFILNFSLGLGVVIGIFYPKTKNKTWTFLFIFVMANFEFCAWFSYCLKLVNSANAQ